ncbi:MAG: serine O-acetyltransferase [Lachnospiraceae bacterium]|nr:serine O-acetyltransferase [Lachnospiraceae bacterium]
MAEEIRDTLRLIGEELGKAYGQQMNRGEHMPDRARIISILEEIRRLMFPGFFGSENTALVAPENFAGNTLAGIYEMLYKEIRNSLLFAGKAKEEEANDLAKRETLTLLQKLPEIQNMLMKDVEAELLGDPAANSKEEIIFSYPGIFAIFVYRVAHELYVQQIPLIPRVMTEYAHGKTGIDINPGATIGEYFFIDHGTGIVIGETTVIGNHVKIYQGVTLGALSTQGGQSLSGVKRHPTIEDNVVIYSNTSILGGETVVGENSVIAGNTFVTKSVPKNTKVSALMPDLKMRTIAE